ncbi:MAG: amidohydrolase family protein [Anaerolineae bacterium]|nr:amidohydrolase family protein [Anaerolineae bacterium]
MLIDAHNHPDWHKHDLKHFLGNMDEGGIDITWLLSWEAPPDEYDPVYYRVCSGAFAANPVGAPTLLGGGPLPFARCLHYKEQAPERFVLGYAPDPRRPDAIDRLGAAVDIYGVQVYGELKLRMMYDNPDALRMFRYCGERGLPITVHIDYEFDTGVSYPRPNWWYGGGIEAFERAVRACPDTVFIGHAPGFWAHISNDGQHDKVSYPKGPVVPGGKVVEMLHAYPNLYADTSAGSGLGALERDRGFAREFLIEFQDRILHGRDCFDHKRRAFLESLDLPAAVLDKIYAGNAMRLAVAPTG